MSAVSKRLGLQLLDRAALTSVEVRTSTANRDHRSHAPPSSDVEISRETVDIERAELPRRKAQPVCLERQMCDRLAEVIIGKFGVFDTAVVDHVAAHRDREQAGAGSPTRAARSQMPA